MKGADKDRAMERFAAGETRLLVATTVIEVGVDVPQATVMVIEHAERFGLAQLHQLRGASAAAPTIRLPAALQGPARRDRHGAAQDHARDRGRLSACRGGLRLRGKATCWHPPVGPARLQGRPRRAARQIYWRRARRCRLALARDPTLSTPRGEALRHLLYLFERDEAIRLIRAG